jgi:uncharacterized membrane protein
VNERALRGGIAAVAAAGIALTAYLLYTRETGGQLVCTTGGCETVQSSPTRRSSACRSPRWGSSPRSGFCSPPGARSELARGGQAAIALAACAFCTYLVFVQLQLIGAVCELCLVSDALIALATVLALLRIKAKA